MKPYQTVPIEECGEALIPIPLADFAVVTPHPYVQLGAPYGVLSPYFLRQSVVQKLTQAQAHLQAERPGWQLQIFDAYRPVPVQQFMVDYTLAQLAQAAGLDPHYLTAAERIVLKEKVLQFWAMPSANPNTPPPHSTGAAVDLTLVDAAGHSVNMGSAIDEISPRSYPHHFENSTDAQAQQYQYHRTLLTRAMTAAGFCQHPHEWWHFSYGDQLWAWITNNQISPETAGQRGTRAIPLEGCAIARYAESPLPHLLSSQL
ncbi:MAG: D-alanyl-D-alanine dipeptidase [Phormidesmis priestleyi]|uniref:D-alanyl-D-alanine dipeptidase n=1 Tax=Phormidesmis priestleyi TaxID=268141 RepID=A0A2W4X0R8_9CYAN|nr:MAG: D-alanyl-D-alanine dipeptidase [Phormidesmis priestleyi]